MSQDLVVKGLLGLLEEAYNGSKDSFFTDGDGLLETLRALSSTQASKPIPPDGLTIAAHTEHLRWSLGNLNNATKGGAWNPDWSASWKLRTVSPADWEQLRSNLQSEYQTFHHTMSSNGEWLSDPMMVKSAVSTIAHAAYHLGAIRAMLKGL